MVTFGPWVQPADTVAVESLTELDGGFDYGTGGAYYESPWQTPADPVEVGEIEEVVTEAHILGGTFGSMTPWGVAYTWGYNLSSPLWQTHIAADTVRRVFAFAARDHWYDARDDMSDPAAIGVEYEGTPFDPGTPWSAVRVAQVGLRVSADTELRGFWDDTSGPPPYQLGSVPDTSLVLESDIRGDVVAVIPGSNEATDSGTPAARTLDVDVDLTQYVAMTGWAGTLHTETLGFPSPVGDSRIIGSTGLVRYGWGVHQLVLNVDLRPPRFRFVYDDAAPPVAYRRTFPRDDALAGGPGRNYPRPRSIQGSNRIGGGYL